MDPLTIASIVGAGVSAVASLITQLVKNGEIAKANALREKVAREYGEEALQQLDKQLAEAPMESAVKDVKSTDDMRAKQLDALTELQNVYRNEGNTRADQDALMLAQNQVGARSASQQAALENSLAQRGAQNSGLALAMRSGVNQDAENTLANMSMQNQQTGRQRALSALTSGANLAGGIRGSDFGEGIQRADRYDSINQFNANRKDRLMSDRLKALYASKGGDLQKANNMQSEAEAAGDTVQTTVGSANKGAQAAIDWEKEKELVKLKKNAGSTIG